jgi:hypothetical protein
MQVRQLSADLPQQPLEEIATSYKALRKASVC